MHAPRAGQCLDLPGACEDLVPEGLTAGVFRLDCFLLQLSENKSDKITDQSNSKLQTYQHLAGDE